MAIGVTITPAPPAVLELEMGEGGEGELMLMVLLPDGMGAPDGLLLMGGVMLAVDGTSGTDVEGAADSSVVGSAVGSAVAVARYSEHSAAPALIAEVRSAGTVQAPRTQGAAAEPISVALATHWQF